MTLYPILMTLIGLAHASMIFLVVFRPSFFNYPERANHLPSLLRKILRVQNEFLVLFLAGFAVACLSVTNAQTSGVILCTALLLFWTTRLVVLIFATTQTRTEPRARAVTA
jgi:hypothetical protein